MEGFSEFGIENCRYSSNITASSRSLQERFWFEFMPFGTHDTKSNARGLRYAVRCQEILLQVYTQKQSEASCSSYNIVPYWLIGLPLPLKPEGP